MPRVLIAEDSATQAKQIQFLLEDAGFEVEITANGMEALEAIGRIAPDIVLTDLQMPEMNGLELVEEIRSKHSQLPVILMTAHGSEEIAAEALQKGAASYVPKRRLTRDLATTLTNVLSLAGADRRHQQLLTCLIQTEAQFVLDNVPPLIPHLVAHLQDSIALLKL